jgi:predicted RNA-binding Zn-ribbon protein involved in translation (DUF1610 family)
MTVPIARTYGNAKRRLKARWTCGGCGWTGVRGLTLACCPACGSEAVTKPAGVKP